MVGFEPKCGIILGKMLASSISDWDCHGQISSSLQLFFSHVREFAVIVAVAFDDLIQHPHQTQPNVVQFLRVLTLIGSDDIVDELWHIRCSLLPSQ